MSSLSPQIYSVGTFVGWTGSWRTPRTRYEASWARIAGPITLAGGNVAGSSLPLYKWGASVVMSTTTSLANMRLAKSTSRFFSHAPAVTVATQFPLRLPNAPRPYPSLEQLGSIEKELWLGD